MKHAALLAVLVGAIAVIRAPAANALDLNLVCDGGGSVNVTRTETRERFDHDGHRRTFTETTTHRRDTDGRVRLEIRGDGGRINLPGQVLPDFHAGSDAGWRNLDQLSITDDRISAHFRLNFISNPSVVVDRASGSITIEGIDSFSFSGDCQRDEGWRF